MDCHWRFLGPPQGTAVLLLHGFGASSGHWRHTAPGLAAKGFRVHALDLIGFGASEQPRWTAACALDNRLWARQVTAFLSEVVGSPTILVGNSLGGLTALTAAVLGPQHVLAVAAAPLPDPALVQAVPARRPPRGRRLQRRLVRLIMRLLPLELIIPLIARTPLLSRGLQGAYKHSVHRDKELLQLIARPARRPTAARALRAMSIGMALRPRGATAPALLERLQGRIPMLLIWGRQDRFVPLSVGRSAAQQFPWLQLEVIDNCGHCPHDETPAAFIEKLQTWLDHNLMTARPAGPGPRR